jgi:hypothetical protein
MRASGGGTLAHASARQRFAAHHRRRRCASRQLRPSRRAPAPVAALSAVKRTGTLRCTRKIRIICISGCSAKTKAGAHAEARPALIAVKVAIQRQLCAESRAPSPSWTGCRQIRMTHLQPERAIRHEAGWYHGQVQQRSKQQADAASVVAALVAVSPDGDTVYSGVQESGRSRHGVRVTTDPRE